MNKKPVALKLDTLALCSVAVCPITYRRARRSQNQGQSFFLARSEQWIQHFIPSQLKLDFILFMLCTTI